MTFAPSARTFSRLPTPKRNTYFLKPQECTSIIVLASSIVANSNLNIENMQNKSHGKNAYTLLEVSGQFDDKVVEELRAIEGVRRVRFIPAK